MTRREFSGKIIYIELVNNELHGFIRKVTEGESLRLTNESDYALRITNELAMIGTVVSAKDLAERTDVTIRFALKILRKLSLAGIVDSKKGAQGGYYLKRLPSEVSIGEIIEVIEGPIHVSNCSRNDYVCPRSMAADECRFHRYFCDLNDRIRRELYEVKLASVFEKASK